MSFRWVISHSPARKASSRRPARNGATGIGYFPWEDWRVSRPAIIDKVIRPRLLAFASAAPDDASRTRRRERVQLCFGFGDLAWDEEKVLERYELLYEAGLVARSRARRPSRRRAQLPA